MSPAPLFTMIAALAFVLGLMGLFYLFLKKMGLSGPFKTMTGPAGKRRLHVIETLPLTAQHRAIILRMDDTDHLVIIGPNGQSIGISPPAGVPKYDPNNPALDR